MTLDGKKIAILATDMFEQVELVEPRKALEDAGAAAEITSWPSIQTDIRNAGGEWVDREVCVDGNLVTSRKPDDIPAFNEKMLELFAQAGARRGVHADAAPS